MFNDRQHGGKDALVVWKLEEVFMPGLARVMFEPTDDGLVCPRVFSVF